MSRVPFPNCPFGEFTVSRPFTAPGLFAYRYMQTKQLLHFPDFAGGDMTEDQRKEALALTVNVQRPLAALILFLGVVALEDFIRDLGARLADVPGLEVHFPNVSKLGPVLQQNVRQYARQDRDPAPLSNWPKVNDLYRQALGIEPIETTDLPILHDLALVRHTVAHHAALVRTIDAPRFQHWYMPPNVVINPPVDFVEEISMLLYRTGRTFENAVKEQIFRIVLTREPANWYEDPSDLVLALVELFNWFGKLISDDRPPPMPDSSTYEDEIRTRSIAIRSKLTQLCIEELKDQYSA
jgi:hypothetical protein